MVIRSLVRPQIGAQLFMANLNPTIGIILSRLESRVLLDHGLLA